MSPFCKAFLREAIGDPEKQFIKLNILLNTPTQHDVFMLVLMDLQTNSFIW